MHASVTQVRMRGAETSHNKSLHVFICFDLLDYNYMQIYIKRLEEVKNEWIVNLESCVCVLTRLTHNLRL